LTHAIAHAAGFCPKLNNPARKNLPEFLRNLAPARPDNYETPRQGAYASGARFKDIKDNFGEPLKCALSLFLTPLAAIHLKQCSRTYGTLVLLTKPATKAMIPRPIAVHRRRSQKRGN